MGKRIAAFVACALAAVWFAAPASAWAVEWDGINVNGIDIVADDDHIVQCGEGTAEYDPDTGKLTLKDADITVGTGAAGVECGIESGRDMSLNIVLVGKNTMSLPMSATSGASAKPVFETCGDITISGPGSLEITSSSIAPNAINAYNGVTIDGARVTVNSENTAAINAQNSNVVIKGGSTVRTTGTVRAGARLVVSGADTSLVAVSKVANVVALSSTGNYISVEDGASVSATGRCYALGGVSVMDDSTLNVTAVGSGYAIDAQGPITVTDSTLKATATDQAAVYAWGSDAITFIDSTVEASSANSYALYAFAGGIELNGSVVTLSAPNGYSMYTTGDLLVGKGVELKANSRDCLGAYGEVVISGGTVDVTVTADASDSPVKAAIYGADAVRISGGTVHAVASKGEGTAEVYALSSRGEIALTGGTITLEGDAGAIDTTLGATLDFGNEDWYQWATSVAGAVAESGTDPYDRDGSTDTYLRIEPAGTTYQLSVAGGAGSGYYVAGTQITVSADVFNASNHFAGWTLSDPTGAGALADPTAAKTTFTMPAGAVELTATYKPHALEYVAAVDPTCTEAGMAEHWTCPECGALFSDAAGTTLVDAAELAIAARGHDFQNGVCTRCDAKEPAKGEIPAAGDASMVIVAGCVLAGAAMLAGGLRTQRGRR